MAEVVNNYNEKDLFYFFQELRLRKAEELNNEKMESCKSEETGSDASFGEKVSSSFKNFGKWVKKTGGRYESKENTINSDLEHFVNLHPFTIDEFTAKTLVLSLFKDDKYGLTKLVFASTIILDDEYSYKYSKEGLECVSNILYGNTNELLLIKKQLEDNYNAISPNSLSGVQKGVLLGTAIVSFAGMITMPMLLGAGVRASAAATTAALAAHGFGDMQIGLAVITAESVLMSAALTGIVYGGMKLYNSAKIKEEFKKLSPEKNALYLAIQCTFIERMSKELDKDDFKEQLDSILKNMNNFKSDLDYYLFVEKESTKENRQKIKSFHEFDNRLLKVLGI